MRFVASAAAAAVGILFAASAAHALEVTETTEFAAPAKKVWKAASPDFCGIGQWHPAIEKCTLSDDKMTRTLTLKGGGGTIVEKQTAWDKKGLTYSYEILESPLPVANYKSTFTIAKGAKKKTSTGTWTSTFDAKGASDDDAKKAISGIYTSGFEALKAKL